MKIIELAGTCDASGDLILTADTAYQGHLEKIEMVYDDGATGSDLTFTEDGSVSQAILTVTDAGVADLTWYPRVIPNKVADASAFTDVGEKICVTRKLKCVVAQGGNAKNFRFLAYVSDE